MREGNIDFARKVFDRFLVRQDERYKTQMELLKQKPDFTVEESLSDDPDKLDYPVDKAEADERWRKKVKLDLLVAKVVEELDDAEAIRKWTIRYRDRNRMYHQIDTSDLLQIYLTSLTRDLRSALVLPGSQGSGGHAQPAASSLAGGDRSLASIGGRLRGGHGDRAGDGGR